MPATAIPVSPYDAEHIEEVPLRLAPLVRVLAQVRHPGLRILSGEPAEARALDIAAKLADHYPVFEAARESGIILTPNGVRESTDLTTPIWRLRSPDEDWQVSFTREFISIETRKYEGRTDFCKRLSVALNAYQGDVQPPVATRIGVRYTNRLDSAEHLARLSSLVRTELLGPASAKLPNGIDLTHSFSQAQYSAPDGGSILNWGLLPPNTTFDTSIAPTSGPSWLLDIDAFSTARMPFDPVAVSELARTLATRAYTHFRWSVTEEFLRVFEGAQ